MRTTLRSPVLLLLIALGLGVAADRLFVGRWVGVSAPLFVLVGLLALTALNRGSGQAVSRTSWWLGGAALLFAVLLAVRDAPTLVLLNVTACSSLLLLLVAGFRGSLFRLPLFVALGQIVVASAHIAFTPFTLFAQAVRAIPARHVRFAAALPLVRGLALALPLLLIFGGLLVAADSVFASYVGQLFTWQVPLNIGELVGHSLVACFVAWACAGGLTTALTLAPAAPPLPAEGATQRLHATTLAWQPLGWVEALTVLLALDGLFVAFVAVQGAYLFGGMGTLDRTGMTFADYARRGFFELVFVACLSLGLLLLLALLTRRSAGLQRRSFNTACSVMVALVIAMLVSAFQRMLLYEQAYGFTELRLYTHSFMIWLAIILLLFVGALLRNTLRLFVAGSIITALIYLLALNIANPLDVIVRANVASHAAGAPLDVAYLGTLSADATPALVAALDQVDPASRDGLQFFLNEQRPTLANAAATQGWPSWHLARARAQAALGD